MNCMKKSMPAYLVASSRSEKCFRNPAGTSTVTIKSIMQVHTSVIWQQTHQLAIVHSCRCAQLISQQTHQLATVHTQRELPPVCQCKRMPCMVVHWTGTPDHTPVYSICLMGFILGRVSRRTNTCTSPEPHSSACCALSKADAPPPSTATRLPFRPPKSMGRQVWAYREGGRLLRTTLGTCHSPPPYITQDSTSAGLDVLTAPPKDLTCFSVPRSACHPVQHKHSLPKSSLNSSNLSQL